MLKEQIQKDLNKAIKRKEELKTSVLRMASAALLNKKKEKRYNLSRAKPELGKTELEKESQLTDEETLEVISSEAKKRKEAILEFEKGERKDLVEKEKKELEILKEYLPEQLSEEEIEKLVKEAIKEIGASQPQDIGKVMSRLMPKVKGRAEGRTVSGIVKELLIPKTSDQF